VFARHPTRIRDTAAATRRDCVGETQGETDTPPRGTLPCGERAGCCIHAGRVRGRSKGHRRGEPQRI